MKRERNIPDLNAHRGKASSIIKDRRTRRLRSRSSRRSQAIRDSKDDA